MSKSRNKKMPKGENIYRWGDVGVGGRDSFISILVNFLGGVGICGDRQLAGRSAGGFFADLRGATKVARRARMCVPI